jgi:hypothetical protein
MPLLILTLSILTIVYSLFIPVIVDALFIYALPIKIISVFAIIMPLGMLMGIPFPSGLRMLGENNESLIPLAWAINGCLSVLTPIAAIMLATAAGFKFVLWIGACAYLLSAVNLWICMRQK